MSCCCDEASLIWANAVVAGAASKAVTVAAGTRAERNVRQAENRIIDTGAFLNQIQNKDKQATNKAEKLICSELSRFGHLSRVTNVVHVHGTRIAFETLIKTLEPVAIVTACIEIGQPLCGTLSLTRKIGLHNNARSEKAAHTSRRIKDHSRYGRASGCLALKMPGGLQKTVRAHSLSAAGAGTYGKGSVIVARERYNAARILHTHICVARLGHGPHAGR